MINFKKIEVKAAVQAGMITAVLLAIYWIGPVSIYESNDDVSHHLLLSGKLLTSEPYPFTNFNHLLSQIFVYLYHLAPAFKWYPFFHIAAIAISVFIINFFYVMAHDNKFIIRTFLSLTSMLPFMYFIQFTKTAFIVSCAGYISLYLITKIQIESKNIKICIYLLPTSLLFLSYGIRSASFFLATIIFSLLFIHEIYKKNYYLMVSIVFTIIVITIMGFVNNNSFDADWKKSQQLWSKLVGPIVDYGHYSYASNKEIYTAAGLSRNDYLMLRSWGAADEEVYNIQKANYIAEHATRIVTERALIPALKTATAFPAKNYLLTLAGMTLVLLILYRQNYLKSALFVLLPFLFCVIYLAWEGRFPPRVSTAMAFSLPWLVLVLSGERRRFPVWLTVLVLLMVIALPVTRQYHDLTSLSAIYQIKNKELHEFAKVVSQQPVKIITLGAAFPYEFILPFETVDYLSGIRFIWLNSGNQSPLQKKQIAAAKMTDIFRSLLTDPDTYIVLDRDAVGILRQYIFEHYRQSINVFPVYQASSFGLFRLVTTEK